VDFPEKLANALATGKRLRHRGLFLHTVTVPLRNQMTRRQPDRHPVRCCDAIRGVNSDRLAFVGRLSGERGDPGAYRTGIACTLFTLT
jgi:hypothetical protein